ncbi:FecCD family ABC transporter permease [Microbacterium sp. No. 7]|uniref:FecCD family ABC transporter permease n=1 Tax=Microbacterium sp. No. 7 TaxID=1714373 RepID=UPI0006ECD809|nr:iron chelate uptake ABC transporter family permease subunit [Microbacterium sp. No. 7]ALJ21659.1 hypothetical protein AOA12_17880 [Microbacterium sp. No. 7]
MSGTVDRPAARTSPAPPTGDARAALASSLHRGRTVLRAGGLVVRFETRRAVVYAALLVVAVVAGIAGILIGDYPITLDQVLAAFVGGTDDPLAGFFVVDVRLPRALAALLVGAALGMSGAIFQTVSGNPLGSPDIIGFTTGAATGALLQIVVFGGDTVSIAIAAFAGGLVTAAVVYGLSWRGGVAGFRLVLVGIGVGAILSAVNALLVVRASLESAQTAAQWLAGSLNSTLWPEVQAIAVALAVLVPLLVVVFRPTEQLTLGDASAVGIGVRVERTRFVLIILGVALMAVATAATGPIAFVALAAPHLVKKLVRTAGVSLFGAAIMGGVLVLVSDLVARRLFAPTELAVGVITGSLGGLYLIWLLAVERKRL